MSKPLPFKEIDGVMYRKCYKCQEYKVFDDFSKNKSKVFCIHNECKECCKKYREQNREKNNKKAKEYYNENKEKINKRVKNYRDNIKSKYGVSQNTLRKRKDEKHKLKCNLRLFNYISLKRALEYHNNSKSDKLPTKSPSRLLLKLYEIQNHNCPYCSNNMKDDIHIDHIIPLSRNGSNEIHNLILCCSSCNLRKSAKELNIWLEECNIDYNEFVSDIDKRNEMYFSDIIEIIK